ncbi:SDR family NAD(P)-dependent oxidoreductase [Sphingomonas jatrophae]|uniref:NAD(P)-dependent dehydrogenase, short-chain alcohol dehydrogenase family n=1 Tax=Sphingomonas jatrophae TaxID=1166337 RepID=A0A1I6M1G8_9SPHN|nr:SDR family oxidoreductase [Sphingomonas jatrophae]SFS09468.1 NAD(P)-dependent dehydrogenase, short-chain alcohol dehydrogenase family [Sphingomonas jatrophae]
MRRLEGKVALVTGGTGGIGAATVARLASEGARVVFTGSNADAAARVCADTGAEFERARVEDAAGWPALMERILARHGRLDIAFANAGVEAGDGSVESISIEGWEQIVAVNLTGVMLTCKAAVTAMRANPGGPGGSIIVNSSMSAYKPMGNFIAYSTTKGALIALTKSVAIHCANQGTPIRANSIHPGVVETDMIKNIIAKQEDPAAARAAYNGMAPLGRMAQVEEVAALVAFLASDEAAFISGSEYAIDGASTAGMMGV